MADLSRCYCPSEEELEKLRPVFEEAVKDTEILVQYIARLARGNIERARLRLLLAPAGFVAIRHGLCEDTLGEASAEIVEKIVGEDGEQLLAVTQPSPWQTLPTELSDLNAMCAILLIDLVGDIARQCLVVHHTRSRILPSWLSGRGLLAVHVENSENVEHVIKQALTVLQFAHFWTPRQIVSLGSCLLYEEWMMCGHVDDACTRLLEKIGNAPIRSGGALARVYESYYNVEYLWETPPYMLDAVEQTIATIVKSLLHYRTVHVYGKY